MKLTLDENIKLVDNQIKQSISSYAISMYSVFWLLIVCNCDLLCQKKTRFCNKNTLGSNVDHISCLKAKI